MDLTSSHFGDCSACFILKKCPYLLNHAFFWLFTLGPISRVKEKAHPNPSWFMSFTFSQVASDLPSSSCYRSLRYPASSDLCSGSAGESRAIFWPSPGSPRPDSPGFTQGTIHCKDVLGSTARFGTQLGIATHTQGAAILAQPPGRTGLLLRSGCSICSETNVHNRSRAVIRELPRGAHILWGKSEWKLFGEKNWI